jgi:4'-phosphopantetheinyl transferase
MLRSKLPHTLSWPLTILRGDDKLTAGLVVAFDGEGCCLSELAADFLGPAEQAYFSTLRFVRRQRSYLLGRYAAKLALRDLLHESDLRALEIARGVFDQPIALCTRNQGWGVTISHAESLAVALAFPAGHPMGIDIERVDSARCETIFSQLSDEEINWVRAIGGNKPEIATALWTTKEALSKVLCTGLMTPIQIYKLTEFQPIGSGIWEGLFQNFGQYKAVTWIGSFHVLSLVLPKRSSPILECNVREVL